MRFSTQVAKPRLKDATGIAETYGCAYKLTGRDEISAGIKYLNTREGANGGTSLSVEEFHSSEMPPFPALVYISTRESRFFTGEQPVEELSHIIAHASGLTGPNSEYLFRIAEWQREFLPLVEDDHLYQLTQMTKETMMKMENEKQ